MALEKYELLLEKLDETNNKLDKFLEDFKEFITRQKAGPDDPK